MIFKLQKKVRHGEGRDQRGNVRVNHQQDKSLIGLIRATEIAGNRYLS